MSFLSGLKVFAEKLADGFMGGFLNTIIYLSLPLLRLFILNSYHYKPPDRPAGTRAEAARCHLGWWGGAEMSGPGPPHRPRTARRTLVPGSELRVMRRE